MRRVKALHRAEYEPIADLITYRVMPTENISMGQLDPFLLLNHHGPQVYAPGNRGLPFGPHPHRGFETVSFIIQGELTHKDSIGEESNITSGGVQWMRAGKGLIHAEISSEEFKAKGGELEILQLWLNLPAKHKMTEPKYIGLQKEDIPLITTDNGKVKVHLIAGNQEGTEGAVTPLINITLSSIFFGGHSILKTIVPTSHNIFFYVVRGELEVNGKKALMHDLVEFEREGQRIEVEASSDSIILFGHGEPLNEPIVAYGPFVMNTREEIQTAYDDFRLGKFGSWSL